MSTADQLNAALQAYVVTIPSAERLRKYIEAHGLGSESEEIERQLRGVVKATEDFLWAQEGGVAWSLGFEERFFRHLTEVYPWLDRAGFLTLLGFSQWFCYHEGLNA